MPTPRGLMTACAIVLFSSAAALCADVLYVNAAATGANDGSSWTDAYRDLQVEQLYAENITGGCATNPLRYCPTNANTRGQMAVFLTKKFNLP